MSVRQKEQRQKTPAPQKATDGRLGTKQLHLTDYTSFHEMGILKAETDNGTVMDTSQWLFNSQSNWKLSKSVECNSNDKVKPRRLIM